MAEAVVSLGAEIPLLPFMGPGASLEPLESAIARVDAVLLGNHGVLTVGPDLETALLRMELVEHLAKIYLISQSVGGPQPLSLAVVETLLESRAKAGLGVKAASAALPPPPADISALVQDALKRFR
jgi:L-fuculose-phosphate aldolase